MRTLKQYCRNTVLKIFGMVYHFFLKLHSSQNRCISIKTHLDCGDRFVDPIVYLFHEQVDGSRFH